MEIGTVLMYELSKENRLQPVIGVKGSFILFPIILNGSKKVAHSNAIINLENQLDGSLRFFTWLHGIVKYFL